MTTAIAICVSPSGLDHLRQQFDQVIEHRRGALGALQAAVQRGASLVCPEALAPAIRPHLIEKGEGEIAPFALD